MASKNKYEILIDFLVNISADYGKVNELARKVQDEFEQGDFGIEFDEEKVKNAIGQITGSFEDVDNIVKQIENNIEDIDFDVDFADAEKSLNEFMNKLEGLEDIDLDALDKAFADLPDEEFQKIKKEIGGLFDEMDTGKYQAEIKKLADEYDNTTAELQQMLNVQKSALAQMKAGGKEGTEAYSKLRNEIDATEDELKKMSGLMEDVGSLNFGAESFVDFWAMNDVLGQIGDSLSQFAEKGLEAKRSLREIQAQTGATNDELAEMEEMASRVFRKGVGDSISDAIKSVGYANQLLGDFLDPQSIEEFTVQAQGIANVFDKDINEVIGGSRTLIANYGLEGKQAADLVALAMQEGGSKMDDVLDTLDEYSQLVKLTGASAQQFVGVLNRGIEVGARDTDKVADVIKETQIRIQAGDFSKPFDDMSAAATGASKKVIDEVNKIMEQAEKGDIDIFDALNLSSKKIDEAFKKGDISKSIVEQMNVAISGTMAEDIGHDLYRKIFSADFDETLINQKAAEAGELMGKAIEPLTFIDKAQKEIEAFYSSASQVFAPFISGAGQAMQSISQIAPAVVMFQQMAGPIKGAAVALGSKFVGALKAARAGQLALNATMLANPYVLALGGVIALVGGIKLLSDALHTTAEERKEEHEAELEGIKLKQKINQENQKHIRSNLKLIDNFEALVKQHKKTGEGEEELKKKMVELNEQYPDVIEGTDSFEVALGKLKEQAGLSREELRKLGDEYDKHAKKAKRLSLSVLADEADIAKGSIEDLLVEVGGFYQNLGDTVSEFLTGTSEGRKWAEKVTKDYTQAIYDAKDETSIKNAMYDFQNALWDDEAFKGLDKTMKSDMKKMIEDFANARIALLKARRGDSEEDSDQSDADEKKKDEEEKKNNKKKIADLKSQYQIAKEKYDVEIRSLGVSKEEADLKAETARLEAGREESLMDEYTAHERNLKLLEDQEKQLVALSKVPLTAEERKQGLGKELKLQLAELRNQIRQEENKGLNITWQMKMDEDEFARELKGFKRKELEFQIELGLADPEELLSEMENDLETAKAKLHDKNLKLTEREQLELKDLILDMEKDIYEKRDEILQDSLDDIEEKYDRLSSDLTKEYEDTLQEFERLNSIYFDTIGRLNEDELSNELKKIDDQESAKLEKYEEWKEQGIISDKQYEQEKARIAEEARKSREQAERDAEEQRMMREAEQAGMRFNLEREQQVKELSVEKQGLEEKINLLKNQTEPLSRAQKEQLLELEKNYKDINENLKIKSDELLNFTEQTATMAGDTLVEAIAGDPDALEKGAKKYLAFLRGYLEKKIAGFILSMILTEGNMAYIASLPFPANIAAIPLIKAGVTAAVNKVAGPILGQLTSFAEGGRVDNPTVAMIGDASLAGSTRNTEWVMRDADMMAYAMHAASMSSGNITSELRGLRGDINSQHLAVEFDIDQLRILLRRAEYQNSLKKR